MNQTNAVLAKAQRTRSSPFTQSSKNCRNVPKNSMHVLLILKKCMFAFLKCELWTVLFQYGIDKYPVVNCFQVIVNAF